MKERINEILNQEVEEENKSLKEIIREWLLRSIQTKKGLVH